MLDVFADLKSGPSCGPEGCEPVAKKDLIVVKEYLHHDPDEIPEWIYNDPELREKYYADPSPIDHYLYEVEVESVFDPNTMTMTVMGFRVGKDVFVRKEN